MSAFDNWFSLQFGKRQRSNESDAALADIVAAGKNAKAELDRRRAWDSARTSALYAWQVTDDDRKKWSNHTARTSSQAHDKVPADTSKPNADANREYS